jgi:hypothetical protein
VASALQPELRSHDDRSEAPPKSKGVVVWHSVITKLVTT